MKKHLFFAFAAAAVLASCSSHDDFDNYSAGTPQAPVDDNSPQEILLGVGAQANVATRGTGTVGGDHNNITTNQWHNQIINVYMFNKYELDDKGTATKPFELAKEGEGVTATPIYNNAKFMAPDGLTTGAARHIDATTEGESAPNVTYKRSYYPMNGNFDFWAYRLDDANYKYEKKYKTFASASAATEGYVAYKVDGNNVYSTADVDDASNADGNWLTSAVDPGDTYKMVYVKTTTNKVDNGGPQFTPGDIDNAKITIPLVIDGTQDVMTAKTALTREDTLTLVDPLKLDDGKGKVDINTNGSISDELAGNTDAQNRFNGYAKSLYSAKTARKGVQPNLVFSHLLTRFTFDAKAYKEDFAANNADEIRIKKIVVYSKTSGNIVAQYKAVKNTEAGHPASYLPDNYKVSEGQDYAIESKLEVDATEKAKPLSLMARIDPAPAPKDENSKLVELTNSEAPGKSRVAYYWLATENGHNAGERYNGEGTPSSADGTYKEVTESGIALPYGKNTEAGKLYTGIGEALLVMPGEEKYVMDITLEQTVYGREDASGIGVPSTIKAIESTITGLEIRAAEVMSGTHSDSESENDKAGLTTFKAGNSYNVRVVVYGMSKIEVYTTLEPWVDGGHIDLDPDNQF